jgi:hypothetical protein
MNTPKKKGKEYYSRTGNSLRQQKHRSHCHNITKMHTQNKVGGAECHHHPTKMQKSTNARRGNKSTLQQRKKKE